jgi:hypothetical protein
MWRGAEVRSVKPSAQPTQVRTLHLPLPARTAPDLQACGQGLVACGAGCMQPDAAVGSCLSLVAGYTRDGWSGLRAGQGGRRGMAAGTPWRGSRRHGRDPGAEKAAQAHPWPADVWSNAPKCVESEATAMESALQTSGTGDARTRCRPRHGHAGRCWRRRECLAAVIRRRKCRPRRCQMRPRPAIKAPPTTPVAATIPALPT